MARMSATVAGAYDTELREKEARNAAKQKVAARGAWLDRTAGLPRPRILFTPCRLRYSAPLSLWNEHAAGPQVIADRRAAEEAREAARRHAIEAANVGVAVRPFNVITHTSS